MRRKYLRKYSQKSSKKNTKKNIKKRNKKRKKKHKKSYKIMKGGSLAGNFFRFLAGESERDKLRVKELKELDQYKKEQQKNEEKELNEHINANNNKLSMEQEEELNNYKNSNDIVDGSEVVEGIQNLNKGIRENNNIDILSQKGGGLLDTINNMEKINFNKWFQGSTNAYNKVVNRNDPDKLESNEWERKVVGGNPHHQIKGKDIEVKLDDANCPMSGGKRRKRKSKKSRKKRRRRRKRKSRKKQ